MTKQRGLKSTVGIEQVSLAQHITAPLPFISVLDHSLLSSHQQSFFSSFEPARGKSLAWLYRDTTNQSGS